MAVQAGSGLRLLRHALGDALVVEHVGVPASLPIVDAERIAGVEALQPWLLVQLAFRHRARTAIETVASGCLPTIELMRPVPPPGLGIGADLRDILQAYKGPTGLLLMIENRDQHPGDQQSAHHRHQEDEYEQLRRPLLSPAGIASRHLRFSSRQNLPPISLSRSVAHGR